MIAYAGFGWELIVFLSLTDSQSLNYQNKDTIIMDLLAHNFQTHLFHRHVLVG